MTTARNVGSGQAFTRPLRFGNFDRGYKDFIIANDDAAMTLPAQNFSDAQALDGTMIRHSFVPQPGTWTFQIIVEDYLPYDHLLWLRDITRNGMGEVYKLWDHRTLGLYATTSYAGVPFPIDVMLTEKIALKVRNHDPFKYDATLSFREAQPL